MRIMYYNEVDKNTITASSEDSGYPIENIQDYQLAKKWRSEAITNLIDRGDCEDTTPPLIKGETSYSIVGGDYARVSDYVYSGSYSWKLTKTNAEGNYAYASLDDLSADLQGLIAGETYTIKAMMRTDSATPSNALIEIKMYYNGEWHWITSKLSTKNQWEEVTKTFTIPSNATILQIKLSFTIDEPADSSMWIDDIELYQHQSIKVDIKSMPCLLERGDCESTDPPLVSGSTKYISGGTYERASDYKHSGSYSWKLTKTSGVGTNCYTYLNYNVSLLPNTTYTLRVYMRATGLGAISNSRFMLRQDYDGSIHAIDLAYSTQSDTWEYKECTFTTHPDATNIWIYFETTPSEDVGATIWIDDVELYSTAKSVKAVFLAGHNLTSNATITVEANSSDDWASPAYSQSMNYDEDMCYLFLDETYEWWRIVINDSDNPDGYIEIGRIFLGDYLQFDDPPKAEIPLVYNDTSKIKYSLTGQAFGDEGIIYKTYNFVFPYWDEDTRTELVTMINEVKTVKPVILVPDENNMDKLKPVYAVINDKLALNHIISYKWNGTLSFREVK